MNATAKLPASSACSRCMLHASEPKPCWAQVRPFPARLERTASEATRMLPMKQLPVTVENGGAMLPLPEGKAVAANAV